jgi:phosphoribosyl 1,2-cyclic phosphodiesterase
VALQVTFWGTRGSIPTPGAGTARYGGNTPCLTIEHDSHLLVLDAGSGLRPLGRALADRFPAGGLALNLLLTHTHWDHIQGFPFFHPLFRPGDRITVLGPGQPAGSLAAILHGQMEPSVFPVPWSAVHASLAVTEITAPELELPGFRVQVVDACHPAPTLGFSVSSAAGGPGVIYLTDNELGAPMARARRSDLVRFLRNSHTLVHDAMYFDVEGHERRGWGHSTAGEAVRLALEAECQRLVLFHHDPDHDDRTLDRLLVEAEETRHRAGGRLEITMAVEGATLRLEDDP